MHDLACPRVSRRLALTAALGLGAALLPGLAGAAEFEWRYYSVSPQGHPYSVILSEAFDRIEERSGGRLDIDLVYFGETPYKGAEAEKLMRDGLGEMTEWLVSYSTSTYPLLSAPELPFLPVASMDPAAHVTAQDKAWESPEVSAELSSILERHDAINLSRFYWPPQNHWLKQVAQGPEDLKGLKIREFSAEGIDFTTAIGAIPVSMTAPDVYSALQRGALDGAVTASTSMTGIKWGEVLKAGYITNFKMTISLVLVSEEAFESLPEDIRPILREEVTRATDEILAFLVANEESLHRQLERGYGFTMVYASDEDYAALRKVAMEAVWPNWVNRIGKETGTKILNEVLSALGAPESF